MTTRRTVTSLALAPAALALVLAGCSAAPAETSSDAAGDYLACAVSGAGGWNDKSFNEQVLAGLEQAEAELGVEVLPFESRTSDDFVPGLESLIDQGCDLVFSVGFDANEAVNAAAAANPGIDFVTVDGFAIDDTLPNLKPVAYDMVQSAFLGGYVAAAHSTTHTVATFGAVHNAAITDFMTGYANGAAFWADETGTPTTVLGWDPETKEGVFVGGFEDQIAAKNIAATQLDQGADVLFPVAGPLFAAVGAAIADTGTDAVFLGVDSDVAVTSPDYAPSVLVSVEKRMTDAVVAIIAEAAAGDFSSEAYLGDLDNGGTGLSAFHDFEESVSPELRDRLAQIAADIISGDIDPRA
ncbi:BMP family lipoprotein [Microbacterium caowuchunii]|uniref:BMP family ABC transporter substrate-binding protein n=1 Tax=Microbacterium caowuchunii TaxID=2614638 RepID=A0A5N0TML1_9MICO|nr:BMP family ABC transporter substrate-binding protein [Microbacterium caowuchunii]KAA9135407.1 BMP family ABC transporter substrate-binding protein [Microbacterium caowuchunii]